jgi:hypothetical protein
LFFAWLVGGMRGLVGGGADVWLVAVMGLWGGGACLVGGGMVGGGCLVAWFVGLGHIVASNSLQLVDRSSPERVLVGFWTGVWWGGAQRRGGLGRGVGRANVVACLVVGDDRRSRMGV